MPIHARWKGKKRAMQINDRDSDEGAGGESGIVLSLEQVNTAAYDA